MNDKITSANIKEFLKDHLEHSEIILLEESKEKNDIMEVAKAKGYILKDSTDLAGFKTIFTFADKANANKARLPKDKLLKALPGIIGKPVDIDHIRTYVVGHYIDYRYIAAQDMVVAYGVFYKSNFGEEWGKAQQLFKAKKLGTSYEVWCPKNKRKLLADGTYELQSVEIAGGGLMFKEKPAFADAMVLEIAKKNIENHSEELVFASEQKNYDPTEILTSADALIGKPISTQLPAGGSELPNTGTNPSRLNNDKVADNVAQPGPQITANQITCSNCNKSFEIADQQFERKNFNDFGVTANSEIKCPECFAILDKSGTMKYPPQIINFSCSCPGCNAKNWKLVKDTPEVASVKCMSCAKNYNIEFSKANLDPLLTRLAFVYIGSTSCHQCGSQIPFSTVNKASTKNLNCSKCHLNFSVDLTKMDKNRQISKISQAVSEEENLKMSPTGNDKLVGSSLNHSITDNTTISSEKGGQNSMSQKPEEQPKVEEVVEINAEVEDAEAIEQEEVLEVSKTLKSEDRNALSNEDFAVVKTVKDKKTGGTSTVRKYPIHDKAHVQNALARLHQAPSREGLKKLGVDVESVITKVKAKGKKLGMETADMEAMCKGENSVAGPDMQKALPRGKDNTQVSAAIEKANEKVAGLTPDQLNQMQNQLFSNTNKALKFKKYHKLTMQNIKALKKAMKEGVFASVEDVDVVKNMEIEPKKGPLETDRGTGEAPAQAVVTGDAPTPKVAVDNETSDTEVNLDADKAAKELADKLVAKDANGTDPLVAPAAPVVNVEIPSKGTETVVTDRGTGEKVSDAIVGEKGTGSATNVPGLEHLGDRSETETPEEDRGTGEKVEDAIVKSSLEVAAIKNENETLKEKILLLETAAVKILERKNALGEFGKDLSDKDILDDDKFEVAKLKKENAELRIKSEQGSGRISERHYSTDETALKEKRAEIDAKAFGPKKSK